MYGFGCHILLVSVEWLHPSMANLYLLASFGMYYIKLNMMCASYWCIFPMQPASAFKLMIACPDLLGTKGFVVVVYLDLLFLWQFFMLLSFTMNFPFA
jgi:hypothetical protein